MEEEEREEIAESDEPPLQRQRAMDRNELEELLRQELLDIFEDDETTSTKDNTEVDSPDTKIFGFISPIVVLLGRFASHFEIPFSGKDPSPDLFVQTPTATANVTLQRAAGALVG